MSLMSLWIVFGDILAISVIVDWITQLIAKRTMTITSSLLIATALYYMWVIIATGGIIR